MRVSQVPLFLRGPPFLLPRLCGAGGTSLPPRVGRSPPGLCGVQRLLAPCSPRKGVAGSRGAASKPQAGSGASGTMLGPCGSWLGMHFSYLEQQSVPGDKRAGEKSKSTGELQSGWRNA